MVAYKLRMCLSFLLCGRWSYDLVACIAAKGRQDGARHASFLWQDNVRSRAQHSPRNITASTAKHLQASTVTRLPLYMALLVLPTLLNTGSLREADNRVTRRTNVFVAYTQAPRRESGTSPCRWSPYRLLALRLVSEGETHTS